MLLFLLYLIIIKKSKIMNNQIETGNLTAKELKDSELVELHKSIFLKYIKTKISRLEIRKTVEKLYDLAINKDNIRDYYNQPIKVFTQALVTDDLESIVKHQSF